MNVCSVVFKGFRIRRESKVDVILNWEKFSIAMPVLGRWYSVSVKRERER